MNIKFTLVTTCRNEIESFPRWKQNVLEQTRRPDEIVVVDAFSDDGTAEALAKWSKEDSRVAVIQEKGAAAFGRNLAIKSASYEHILSTDMGVRLSSNWCEELIAPFERDPDVEIVAGNYQNDIETLKTAVARADNYIEKGGFPQLKPGFFPINRSVAYLRRVWAELGGLPEDLTFYADDSVFGRQMVEAEYKMEYSLNAMAYWARPNTLKEMFKENYNYGVGDGEAMIKVPFAYKLYKKRYIPRFMVPSLTGIRLLQKQFTFSRLYPPFRGLDISGLIMIPVLLFGRGYNFGKGFLVGEKRGETQCVHCRNRLKEKY